MILFHDAACETGFLSALCLNNLLTHATHFIKPCHLTPLILLHTTSQILRYTSLSSLFTVLAFSPTVTPPPLPLLRHRQRDRCSPWARPGPIKFLTVESPAAAGQRFKGRYPSPRTRVSVGMWGGGGGGGVGVVGFFTLHTKE